MRVFIIVIAMLLTSGSIAIAQNPHQPRRHKTKPQPKKKIQVGTGRTRPTDLARSWLQ
jgi:hypothetical protein